MSKINPHAPAFGFEGMKTGSSISQGLTKREYLAAMFMSSLLVNSASDSDNEKRALSKKAVLIADNLILTLNNEEKTNE